MKKSVLTAAALTVAAPALAQTERAAPVGPRIEGRVGYERVVAHLKATTGTTSGSESGSKGGVTYGGEIGYDLRAGQYATVGLYAGIDDASTKQCTEVYGGDEACLKAGRNITAGVRAGYMFGRGALFYVKGGYSNGRLKLSYDDGIAADRVEGGINRDGLHIGAGVEQSFMRNVYGKLEYVYTTYNKLDFDNGATSGRLDFDRHRAVAGVGIRF